MTSFSGFCERERRGNLYKVGNESVRIAFAQLGSVDATPANSLPPLLLNAKQRKKHKSQIDVLLRVISKNYGSVRCKN